MRGRFIGRAQQITVTFQLAEHGGQQTSYLVAIVLGKLRANDPGQGFTG